MNSLLWVILFLPLFGALAVALLPRQEVEQCRHVGFIFALATFLVSLALLAGFDPLDGEIQLEVLVPWISSLGVNFHVGVDGISLWLVLLTTFLTPIVVAWFFG